MGKKKQAAPVADAADVDELDEANAAMMAETLAEVQGTTDPGESDDDTIPTEAAATIPGFEKADKDAADSGASFVPAEVAGDLITTAQLYDRLLAKNEGWTRGRFLNALNRWRKAGNRLIPIGSRVFWTEELIESLVKSPVFCPHLFGRSRGDGSATATPQPLSGSRGVKVADDGLTVAERAEKRAQRREALKTLAANFAERGPALIKNAVDELLGSFSAFVDSQDAVIMGLQAENARLRAKISAIMGAAAAEAPQGPVDLTGGDYAESLDNNEADAAADDSASE